MTTTSVPARRKFESEVCRHSRVSLLICRLSRSRLEATCGRLQDAERVLQEGEAYVLKRGDRVLQAEWIVETAWLKIQRGDLSAASRCLDRLATVARQGDVGRRADLHWLRGHLSRAGGESDASQREFARAGRIWQELGGRHPSRILPLAVDAISEAMGPSGDICDVAALTTLMSLGSRPRLLGIEAASLIGCDLHATRVRVTVGPSGSRRIVFDRQRPETTQPKNPTHSVELGDQDGLPWQLAGLCVGPAWVRGTCGIDPQLGRRVRRHRKATARGAPPHLSLARRRGVDARGQPVRCPSDA